LDVFWRSRTAGSRVHKVEDKEERQQVYMTMTGDVGALVGLAALGSQLVSWYGRFGAGCADRNPRQAGDRRQRRTKRPRRPRDTHEEAESGRGRRQRWGEEE
jgi:hypothetical protein